MRRTFAGRLLFVSVAASLAACQSAPLTSGDAAVDASARRAAIDQHAEQSLTKMYVANPGLKAEVESAPGYAVFDLSAVNAVLLVGQQGKGVLVERASGTRTYMKALRGGTGPGVGYQELRQVFVFTTEDAMSQFKLGGKVGGDVSTSVTVGTSNRQQSFNTSVKTYQLTEKGFALQANWGGTAYLVDTELN